MRSIAFAVTGILQGIVKNGIEHAAKAAAKNADDLAKTANAASKAAAEGVMAADDVAKSMSSKLDNLALQERSFAKHIQKGPMQLRVHKAFTNVVDSQILAQQIKKTTMDQADVLIKTADAAVSNADAAMRLGGKNFKFAAASGALMGTISETTGRQLTATVVEKVAERLMALSADETDPWKRKNLNVLGHYVMLVNIALGEALKKKRMGSRNIISFSGGPKYQYNYESGHSQEDGMDTAVDMQVGGGMGTDDDILFGPVGLDMSTQSDMRYNLAVGFVPHRRLCAFDTHHRRPPPRSCRGRR